MASFSVYGYDKQMLPATTESSFDNEGKHGNGSSDHERPHTSTSCPLLEMPVEVRNHIYQLVVPTTTQVQGKGTAWLRGSTAFLVVNKQIYFEAIKIMYGTSTFVIDVRYNAISFAYQWILPSGLVPKTTFVFPTKFAERNLALIRRYQIRVQLVDSYTGMIKYNISGHSPLVDGVRDQVAKLVSILGNVSKIHQLQICLQDDYHGTENGQSVPPVLLPFVGLKNTHIVSLSGNITPDLQKRLQDRLTNAYMKNSLFRLPLELREIIYNFVLPYTIATTDIPPWSIEERLVHWQRGYVAILATYKSIYRETSSIMYQGNDFEFHYNHSDQVWKFMPLVWPRPPGSDPPAPNISVHLVDIRFITIDTIQNVSDRFDRWGPHYQVPEKLNRLFQQLPRTEIVTFNRPLEPMTFRVRRLSNERFALDFVKPAPH